MSLEPDGVHAELAPALGSMGLIGPGESFRVARLSGGVSCDVWLVADAGGRRFVVKRALPKLRVAADWRAPPQRSHTEVEWLKLIAGVDESLVPVVLAEDPARHLFAMEYLPPAQNPLWKAQLASGTADPAFAAAVGRSLSKVHSATAHNAEIARRFDNRAQFMALRLESYLLHTAGQHPDLGPAIRGLADSIATAGIALMQGDISPKNILRGTKGPVFLDAETACYGDPAFDLAFCLNHLLLKCVWHPEFSGGYLACFTALESAYIQRVTWEDASEMEKRTAMLLPALLLARIDGKSPVEYITAEPDKIFVRRFARSMLSGTETSLKRLRESWRSALSGRRSEL